LLALIDVVRIGGRCQIMEFEISEIHEKYKATGYG